MVFFQVIGHLFQKNSERQDFGLDLLAINIQRGRSLMQAILEFYIEPMREIKEKAKKTTCKPNCYLNYIFFIFSYM